MPKNSDPFQLTASIVLYKSDPAQLITAARSVLDGSLHCHLVLIDNSPTDTLHEVAAQLNADYIFTGHNLGFGAGHNLALRKCLDSSPYHLILNPDVRFDPTVLHVLYEFMQANRQVGMIMPKVLYFNGSEQQLCKLLPSPFDLVARRFSGRFRKTLFRSKIDRYQLADYQFNGPTVVPNLSGCFMFIRTDILKVAGLFDERYFMYMEDVDLCRRIGNHSLTVFYPGVSIFHEYAMGSYRDRHLLRHHIASAYRYFSKWGWIRDKQRDYLNARILPV